MRVFVFFGLLLVAAFGMRGLGKAVLSVSSEDVRPQARVNKAATPPLQKAPMQNALLQKVKAPNSMGGHVCASEKCTAVPVMARKPALPNKAADVKVVAFGDSVIGAAFKASLLRADAADVSQNMVMKPNDWSPKELPGFRLVPISELPNGMAVSAPKPELVNVATTFDTSYTCLGEYTCDGSTCSSSYTCDYGPTYCSGTCAGEYTCDYGATYCASTCSEYTCENGTCGSTCYGSSTCSSGTCAGEYTCDYSPTICGGGTCYDLTCANGPTCYGTATCDFGFTCMETCDGNTCSYGTTCLGQLTCETTCFYSGPTCDGGTTCSSVVTCDGSYTCESSYTCGSTCTGPTCYGETTCEGYTCDSTCYGNTTCDFGATCWGMTCEVTLCYTNTCDGAITCDPSMCVIVNNVPSAPASRASQFLYALLDSFANLV